MKTANHSELNASDLSPHSSYNPVQIFLVVGVAAMGGMLFGFDTSIVAGATPFILEEFQASHWQIELIVSATPLGALIGALFSGRLADIYSRKHVLIAASILSIIGCLIAGTGTIISLIIAGRLMLGVAIGISSYAAPLYIAEVAPPEKRGGLVLWNGALITGGQLIAYGVSYYFTDTGNWRAMILSGALPAIALMLGTFLIPYSPKWLIFQGRTSQALTTLQQLRRYTEDVHTEIAAIKNNLHTRHVRFRDIFARKYRSILLIGIVLGVSQQFFGINTVLYYGPFIMKHIGFSGSEAQILGTSLLGLVDFIFTVVTILYIDRVGRRRFLLVGSITASFSLFAMIILLSVPSIPGSSYIAIICLIFYIIGYCISVGSLFWLIIAEIFPLQVRGTCMSFVTSIQWGANFIVSMSFLSILEAFGVQVTFSIYATIAALTYLYILKYIPETKHIALEVIEHNIERGAPSRYLGDKNWSPE